MKTVLPSSVVIVLKSLFERMLQDTFCGLLIVSQNCFSTASGLSIPVTDNSFVSLSSETPSIIWPPFVLANEEYVSQTDLGRAYCALFAST